MREDLPYLSLNKNKKRNVVLKPIPVLAIFFIVGLVGCIFLYNYIVWIYLSLVTLAFGFWLIGLFDKRLLLASLIIVALSLEGFVFAFNYNKNLFFEQGYYSGTGNIVSVSSSGYVTLDNVTIEGKKVKGKVNLNNIEGNVGDYIGFAGELTTNQFDSVYSVHNIAKDVYYNVDVDFYQYMGTSFLSLRDKIKLFIRENFNKFGDEDSTDYLMSIMFGESEYLDRNLKDSFVSTGVAHVFAVSGLHVGVLCGAIGFLLKKFKTPKQFIPFIKMAILIFYAYLCDFTPSVIRAGGMILLSEFLLNYNLCNDRLSVLSFCALTSLVIKPIWIGDMSFWLSYGAILGIYLVYPKFKVVFGKFGRFKKLCDLMALNLSVSLSLLPMTAYFFGRVSPLSIIGSLLIIPLTSVLYILGLASIPLCTIKFLATPVLWTAKYLVLGSAFIANTLSSLESDFSFGFSGIGLPLWYLSLFVASDFVRGEWYKKSLMSVSFISVAFLL